MNRARLRRLARGSGAEPMTDHQAQVVGRDLDQVALLDLPGAAQPSVARAADAEDKGEATLNLFGAHLESLMGNCALQPRPIVVDGPANRVVAVPTGKRLLLLGAPLP